MALNLALVSGIDLLEGVQQILADLVCSTPSAFGAFRSFICIGSCAVVTPSSAAVPFSASDFSRTQTRRTKSAPM
jgi:hypothetical protein